MYDVNDSENGSGNTVSASPASSPEEIQQEIERTRAQLGETAGALAHKLDPKAQAKERFDHARAATQEKTHRAQQAGRDLYRERPTLVVGMGAGVALLVVVAVVWRRNR
jgi:ElaB/YqjD/DUF883 family membrane-anchored ribosome-binding protein